jgi:hypothetical protein
VTLEPQRSWIICQRDDRGHECVVGCADCECGGVLWGEEGAAVAEARAMLAESIARRKPGPRRIGERGPSTAGAKRVLGLARAHAR